jgi:predicted TIM-barrel fold metal-dependent hydrolase
MEAFMIVDVNMGWFPEELFTDEPFRDALLRCVPKQYGHYAEVRTLQGTNRKQIVIETPKGYEGQNMTDIMCDEKSREEILKAAKVDKALLQMSIWSSYLDLEMSKKLNNMMAKFLKEHPGKYFTVALVPPLGDRACLYELERCIKELGFSGAICTSHYGSLYVDEDEFKPFWKKVSELNVPAIIHHTHLPVQYDSLLKYANIRRFYGRCVDQMTSLARMLYSDILSEFPNLKLIYTMFGGGFFAYANILAPKKSGVQEEIERFDTEAEKVKVYLQHNVYFDISHAMPWGKDQLECAVKVLGADHILFGGGYPVRREWLLTGVDYIRSLNISDKEKSLILGENAVKVLAS